MTHNVTIEQAELVLAELKRKYAADVYGDSMQIIEDFSWGSSTVPFAIIWEEGPYAWAMTESWEIKVDGVVLEPYTTWALSIHTLD